MYIYNKKNSTAGEISTFFPNFTSNFRSNLSVFHTKLPVCTVSMHCSLCLCKVSLKSIERANPLTWSVDKKIISIYWYLYIRDGKNVNICVFLTSIRIVFICPHSTKVINNKVL